MIDITMMIILRGGFLEQLTFILSEFRAALAVINLGRGSRQLQRSNFEIVPKLYP